MRDHGVEMRERAHSMLDRGGYDSGECGKARGGQVAAATKALVMKAVHEHEAHDHSGEKKTKLRLRSGGEVHGHHAKHRPDKRARGGAMDDAGVDERHEEGEKGRIGAVNIAIGNPEKEQAAKQQGLQLGMQIGMQRGVQMAAAKMGGAGGPPGAAPPPGAGMPPSGAAMPPGAGMPPRPAMPPPGAAAGPPGMMPPRARGGYINVKEHKRRRAGGGV